MDKRAAQKMAREALAFLDTKTARKLPIYRIHELFRKLGDYVNTQAVRDNTLPQRSEYLAYRVQHPPYDTRAGWYYDHYREAVIENYRSELYAAFPNLTPDRKNYVGF